MPQSPPIPILIGALVPPFGFIGVCVGSGAFREMVLAADLWFVTAIQAWRAGGLGFLALYTHGVLPGLFAIPAGVGDIAIGVTAPWVVLALIRRPAFAASPLFVGWNLLGILDLIVAVSMGTLDSGFISGIAGRTTTAAMAQLPLVLIPGYLVPLFVMCISPLCFRLGGVTSSERRCNYCRSEQSRVRWMAGELFEPSMIRTIFRRSPPWCTPKPCNEMESRAAV